MKIAILAWGSLLWEKDNVLTLINGWAPGGPKLPIEFSRVSCTRNGALTLVIDSKNGVETPTYFGESSFSDLNEAILALRDREGTSIQYIGYVNCKNGQSRSNVLPAASSKIRDWAEKNNFDAVIWTDLPPNFDDRTGNEFSVDNAQTYLHKLQEGAAEARKYIKNTPPEVKTPLRKRMHEDPWLYL